MKNFLTSFINDERGVSAIEYAVLAGAVGAVVAAVFGGGLTGSFGTALKAKLDAALAN